MSRKEVLWKPFPGRQTAPPPADQMGPAAPTVALPRPTDTWFRATGLISERKEARNHFTMDLHFTC